MNRKVLVLTGCAGFIGFNFLKHIIEVDVFDKYEQIISIDKRGYAAQYNLNQYDELCDEHGIVSVEENINNLTCFGFFSNPRYTFDVINFASESHVDNSIADPARIFEENSMLVVNLVKLLPMEKINKFIQISTDEVYGDLPLGTQYDDWFKIGDEFKPSNPYSASKVAQDAYLMSMRHTFGLKVQFVRMANQFGPHQHPEKMLPASILRSLRGEHIKVYGTGDNIRQWTPVVQTVKVIYDQLFNENYDDLLIAKKYLPLINNNEVVDEWIHILEDHKGHKSAIEYIEDRKGHDLMYALQTTEYVDKFFDTDLTFEFTQTLIHYMDNEAHYSKRNPYRVTRMKYDPDYDPDYDPVVYGES